MSVLRFDNVSKQYSGGHQALRAVSFTVAAGEMLFVTGHSGAGKSTLLKLIHLTERPSRGAVLFGDRNLLKVRGRRVALHRRDIGIVFQDHRLLADRSVADNVGLPLLLRGLRRADINKRVRVTLDQVGLGARATALPGQLSAGEMLFVTGHSGAGKSTLLKLIHLSERPSRGAVLFGERNLLKVRGRRVALHRRDVGVVFQDHRLLADRSVEDNVGLPLLLRGLRRGDIAKRVRVALDKVGLGGRARAVPTQLSAGEQQRVGIARAIVAEPRLLVADEPTGNLDPTLSAEIMALFESLPGRGTSVLVASHDLALVRRMKKRVLVLNDGRLVDDIAPQDLAQ